MKVPGIRTNFFNELEMKKSYFEEILRSNNLMEHWNIWSNDDAQEYLRKRSETATSAHSDDTPMEISRTPPQAPAEEPAAPPEEEEQTPVMQQNYDVDWKLIAPTGKEKTAVSEFFFFFHNFCFF